MASQAIAFGCERRLASVVSPPSARVAFIDVARGLCIVLVVAMHATLGVGEAMDGRGFMHTLVDFAKPFRIPAFFLVAGLFACAAAHAPWRRFIDGKILHFVYFYVLWAAIQIFLKDFVADHFAARDAARALLYALVEPYGVLWFIFVLPIFYSVVRVTQPLGAALVAPAALLLNIATIRTGWSAIDQFAEYFVYFYIGATLGPHIIGAVQRVLAARALAVMGLAWWAAIEAAATLTAGSGAIWTAPGANLAFGLAGGGAVLVLSGLLAPTWLGQVLSFVGRRSLIVYLAFFLPMAAMRVALVRIGWIGDVGAASLVVTAVAVIAPLALSRLAGRMRLGFLFTRPKALRL